MRFKKEIPAETTRFIRIETKHNKDMHRLYLLRPVEIGEAQYVRDDRAWISDDGMKFMMAADVEKYLLNRQRMAGRSIEPGEYSVNAVAVTQAMGKLIIKLESGEEIVIFTQGKSGR